MTYTKNTPSGLGKLERKRLSSILLSTSVTITVAEAAAILNLPRQIAAKQLALFAKKGWLSRIRQGVYIPSSIEAETNEVIIEDPLLIAEKLFSPCYIAGWSAAEYWGLTDQIFSSTIVMTQQPQRKYQPEIQGTAFLLHLAQKKYFFGLNTIWRNNVKIQVSDQSRTIIDIMSNPALGGGIRMSVDILKNYFSSDAISTDNLIQYLAKRKNGAAYKRLGFLTEKFFPENTDLLCACKKNITSGNTTLDTTLKCDKLSTKWRVWVPENWK
ncbi:MAG: type IV toxin-antitoxin system AbiEi family antitoxin domain-containing protein [Coxiellaceae bacterium]|nr:type IV toxin-antitoxin system AbiEi family antitoxin domain-containing protein [Coxiellaceae bacterium]